MPDAELWAFRSSLNAWHFPSDTLNLLEDLNLRVTRSDLDRQGALAGAAISRDVVRQNKRTCRTRGHADRGARGRTVDGAIPADQPTMRHGPACRNHGRAV